MATSPIVTVADLDPATLTVVGNKVVAQDPTKAPDPITVTPGLTTPIATGDTVNVALSKLQGQISAGSGAVYKANIGDGAALFFDVPHNLNSLDVSVSCYEISTRQDVYPSVSRPTVNTVRLTFTYAIPAASHRVIVR